MRVMDANELYDPDFRKLIKSKKQTIIIPIGSIEQHGAHLPITTDSDIVTEIASRLAKKCGFIVFPTISYGVSFEHLPLFNTSITEETLAIILDEIISSLKQQKIDSIIILNGHHGNIPTLEDLTTLYTVPKKQAKYLEKMWKKGKHEYDEAFEGLRGQDIWNEKAIGQIGGTSYTKYGSRFTKYTTSQVRTDGDDKIPRFYSYWHFMKHEFDHAGFVETSLMLAISDKVKMKKAKKGLITEGLSEKEIQRINKLSTQPGGFPQVAKNGVWGDPTKATKKDGEKFLAEIVRNLAKECQT